LHTDFSGASEGGFGLYVIEQSVDSVEYTSPMPGIASVRLVKRAGERAQITDALVES
jgi:anti-sigma regulatory factor (Ser/Thr protein kinase)